MPVQGLGEGYQMSVIQAENARRGGREARRALRAAPLALNERPVWPGLNGGNVKPLTEADQQRIHQAALDVLEQVGFADAIPSGIEAMTRVGAKLESNGRLTFPRALVEDTIAMAARKFPLCGQDPKFDMEPRSEERRVGKECRSRRGQDGGGKNETR